MNKDYGFQIFIRGCAKSALVVHIRDSNKLAKVAWGNASEKFLSEKWSHLLFTYKYSLGLSVYFNGAQVRNKEVGDYHKFIEFIHSLSYIFANTVSYKFFFWT